MNRNYGRYSSGGKNGYTTDKRNERKGGNSSYKGHKIIWSRLMLLCASCALVLFGAIRLTVYLVASSRERKVNDEIVTIYESSFTETPAAAAQAVEKTPAPTAPKVTAASAEPTATLASTERGGLLMQYRKAGGKMLPQMSKLYDSNRDIIGWVQIPGVVSLPVVYRDNVYYLDHDFNKVKNNSGTLFLDANHPLASKSQYLVIHGHNMHDGSMFGIIPHYKRTQYIKDHGIAWFSSLYTEDGYVAFAVIHTSTNRKASNFVAYTGTPTFSSITQFDAFVNLIKKNSLLSVPIDVQPSDALLALSTCDGDDRIVVFFRKIRANESEQELVIKLKETHTR